MKKRYKRTFLVLYAFCSLLVGGVSAQSLVLSLEKTISLAADSSLEAFRTKKPILIRLLGVSQLQGGATA